MVKILKRTGYDWIIDYQFDGEESDSMTVFGALTIDQALQDAKDSLSFGDTLTEDHCSYKITGIQLKKD